METYDKKQACNNNMEFVDVIADKIKHITSNYNYSEQTAVEICRLSIIFHDSFQNSEYLKQQNKNAEKIQDELEDISNAIWGLN